MTAHAIVPGVGWGPAVLGAEYATLENELGAPTRVIDRAEDYLSAWLSLGLEVLVAKSDDRVTSVVLVSGQSDDRQEFTCASGETDEGIAFDANCDDVIAALGEPRRQRSADDGQASWSWLDYSGIGFLCVGGSVAEITIHATVYALPTATNEELEAAIVANPDDPGPYAVYGDWMQQQGDPRGELVTIQHARLKSPEDRELALAEKAYLDEHGTDLLGELADYVDMLRIEWHLGFIRRVKVANTFERSPDRDGEDEQIPVEDIVRMVLDSESGRFVQDLTVGIVMYVDNTYTEVIAVLAERRRPLLRTLFLGDFKRDETELNWSDLGDASPIYAALPNLRSLTLRSGTLTLGAIELPELRELVIRTGGLTKSEIASIVAAHWPRLERLSLHIGSASMGSDVGLADLQPLLDGECLPATLAHLGIANSEFTDALVPLLASSRILPRLRELDLSLGTLGPWGAAALVEAKAAFRHLERLDLSQSFLDADALRRVAEVCPNVVVDGQRWDARYPDSRYIAAGE